MKTLIESILNDIESTMHGAADAVNDEFNINTLPTENDFTRSKLYKNMYDVTWYCPNFINKYKSKYPEVIINGFNIDSIGATIEVCSGGITDCRICFTSSTDPNFGKYIEAWEGSGSSRKYTVAKCKTMLVDFLSSIAHNPRKMKAFLDFENSYNPRKDERKNFFDDL